MDVPNTDTGSLFDCIALLRTSSLGTGEAEGDVGAVEGVGVAVLESNIHVGVQDGTEDDEEETAPVDTTSFEGLCLAMGFLVNCSADGRTQMLVRCGVPGTTRTLLCALLWRWI